MAGLRFDWKAAMTLGGYFAALLLTEIIRDRVVAPCARFQEGAGRITAVLLVNLVTHPLLHYYALLHQYYPAVPAGTPVVLLLEAGVVFAEWGLLATALKERSKRSLFVLSATMNTCSFVAGLFIVNTRVMQIFAR